MCEYFCGDEQEQRVAQRSFVSKHHRIETDIFFFQKKKDWSYRDESGSQVKKCGISGDVSEERAEAALCVSA
ncbi:hypothetical protein [Streptomyces hygroscopicus]|uniref:hypothetical protein n=1 Tax=Streptomyces hygroscopicus TaxID=1912 RepID=UPI003F1BC7F2